MKKLVNILLYLWQLPQNIVGLILYARRHRDMTMTYKGKFVGVDDRFVSDKKGDRTHNGVSLGNYIILEKYKEEAVEHEYGHCRQSEIIGPAYLLIIGVCSGIHNVIHRLKKRWGLKRRDYYCFWTERWADRLGGVKR